MQLTRKVGRRGQAPFRLFFRLSLEFLSCPRYTPDMRKKTKHKNLPFLKMHGLGNDFVVIDSRNGRDRMTPEMARAIGNRHTGVGFDQLAVITKGDADIHLTFYNSDGSTAAACGNATRCIARYIMEDTGKSDLRITTERGDLFARDAGDGMTSVNMGHPLLNWDEIPLSREMDTLKLDLKGEPTATGMGNPHCTFFCGKCRGGQP